MRIFDSAPIGARTLRILDALMDLGNRRSAALEQTEASKSFLVRQSSEASGAPLVAKDPPLSRRVEQRRPLGRKTRISSL